MPHNCFQPFIVLAKEMLAEDEGERQFAYDDSTGKTVKLDKGNLTIGIGRNLSAKGLSPDEIELIFTNDIYEAIDIAREIFPQFDGYATNRRLGIVNLIFNMGKGNSERGFLSFDNTIQCIKDQNWAQAAENLKKSAWYHQVKDRAPRVVALIGDNRYDYGKDK